MSTRRTNEPLYDADLAHARWRRSSYSGGANDCVEIAELDEFVAVRDSKNIALQPLLFSRLAMHALIDEIVWGTNRGPTH
ncbi:DUF397 domain-containing protein [Streptomyces sp. NEAU-NA10]|uniref:DUF397 domain-containing protein n=1 Tax=Streptomyces sp. NEAU-NA10 TaxID=3416050 RepID=UPI003CC5FDEF